MKLTPFGLCTRTLRLELGLTLKSMANALGVSSAYLSSIELGERQLTKKVADDAIDYLRTLVPEQRILELKEAIDRSAQTVPVDQLQSDDKVLVAAFARRLSEGDSIPDEIKNWLSKGGVHGHNR